MDITGWLREQLEEVSPDLLRAMVQEFAEALMGAEADALCGAGYGERTPERGQPPQRLPRARLRHARRTDRTRSPEATRRLVPPRLASAAAARVEQAFVSVIAEAYLAGVSTRRVELVQELGSSVCRRARSRARPSRSIGSSRTSARGRLRARLTHLVLTRSRSSAGRAAGRSTPASCTRSPSIGTAPASRSASMSSPRGRRRMARLLALARRPRPLRSEARHLGRALRARRRQSGDASGRELATLPHPFMRNP
jgi:Transposase, Mutator family